MVYLIIIRGTQKTLKNRQSKTNKKNLLKSRQISNTHPTINVGILISTGVCERYEVPVYSEIYGNGSDSLV